METTVSRVVRRALYTLAGVVKRAAAMLELATQDGFEVCCTCGRVASVLRGGHTSRDRPAETMCPVCLHKMQQAMRPPVRLAVTCQLCGAPASEVARGLTNPLVVLAAHCKSCMAKLRAGKAAS